MQVDVRTLRDDHTALLAMAETLSRLLAQPAPPPQLEFFSFRRDLTRRLIRHLTTEDWVLYPALMRSADPAVAAVARRFSAEMGGLLLAYRAWSDAWPNDRVCREWPDFRVETTILLAALKHRTERENRDLYPLAERAMRKAA